MNLRALVVRTMFVSFFAWSSIIVEAQSRSILTGAISDELGSSIVGATVTLTDSAGVQRTAITGADGRYSFRDLPRGKYRIHAMADGFAQSEDSEIDMSERAPESLSITLKVAAIESRVNVNADVGLSIDPSNNANQTVLTGREIDVLPDDPVELAAALQALAGPSIGPNGGEILVDGFSGGNIPPKQAIREVRINQNPFAAENESPSTRTEIFTRPGTNKLQGSIGFNFSDESLNSRNPFQISDTRSPFQTRQWSGNLSGPLKKNKASFFLDFSRNETDDNELIRATVLDAFLSPLQVGQVILSPRHFTTISPRVDYLLNPRNTLITRYSYTWNSLRNLGVNGFSLPERGFDQSLTSELFQITETSVLNATALNETRFQYIHNTTESQPALGSPTLSVSGSFVGGGASNGHVVSSSTRFELQNFTQLLHGQHTIKFGGRLRTVKIHDSSPAGFNGLWVFAGGAGGLTSLQRYQLTLQLMRQGLTAPQIRAAGGGASQFSITVGNPRADVSQYDVALFGQDDWKVRPNLTLSYGLRYERQNNANSDMEFAPRFSIAWAPGRVSNGKQPTTVIRVGGGLFYSRFNEGSTLNVHRYNGVNVQQFIFSESANLLAPTDPFTLSVLNSFRCVDGSPTPDCVTNLPSIAGASPTQQTIWRVDPNLRAPTTYGIGAQVERQLPHNFTVTVAGFAIRMLHVIRSRDINAPIPQTIGAANPSGLRPNPTAGEINQFESTGRWNQTGLFVSFNSRLNPHFSLTGNYFLSKIMNDGEGQGPGGAFPPFPRDSYDLSGEWGRGGGDVRHRFTLFATFNNPKLWKLIFAPMVVANSALPFNIITGIDSNLDRQFTERPSFAGANANCISAFIRCTRFGNFNLLPASGEQIIPRNFGRGTPLFAVNLRISRTFGFGRSKRQTQGPKSNSTETKYNLTMSVQIQNLLNSVNLAPPIGNLSSPLFGQSQGLFGIGVQGGGGSPNAGNRRVYLNLRLSF